MGDTSEVAERVGDKAACAASTTTTSTATAVTKKFGFTPKYLCSIPGLLRLLNIGIGIVTFGLWIPGYGDEFLGERINQLTGDTEKGYGNGWKREPLNQFVMAAIIIALISSIFLLFGLICIKSASVDMNRFNKFMNLGLALFLFVASICAICGVWYFNENCCHVSMSFEGTGLAFSLTSSEFHYIRHCYCYLTKYLNLGSNFQVQESQTEVILFDAVKNPDISGFDRKWTFAAHDLDPHISAIFFLFLNSFIYFLACIFSKTKN